MDGHSVDIRVVNKPNDLVAEQLGVVLRVEVGLRGLRTVELQALADSFPQHVNSRVGLHDLVHGLLEKPLAFVEPIAKTAVQVVSEINGNDAASW